MVEDNEKSESHHYRSGMGIDRKCAGSNQPLEKILNNIIYEVNGFQGEQSDDMTLVVIRKDC